MEAVEFRLWNDHPIAGPGWVYAWIHDGRVFYVGATWLHPAARVERHLHAETTDPRSLAIRELVGTLDVPPTIVALPVPESYDRQVMKATLIRECTERGWLADGFIGPGAEQHEGRQSDDWVAEAVMLLRGHLD